MVNEYNNMVLKLSNHLLNTINYNLKRD